MTPRKAVSLVLFIATAAPAARQPVCYDSGSPLTVNNAQVLEWKTSTENQFRARGHIVGKIVRRYSHHNGHTHFSAQLDIRQRGGTIEIIYNDEFGRLPPLYSGMSVEACGDYITSIRPSGPYPASPDGALIHWVHYNPNGSSHDDGYLILDGELYGQGRW